VSRRGYTRPLVDTGEYRLDVGGWSDEHDVLRFNLQRAWYRREQRNLCTASLKSTLSVDELLPPDFEVDLRHESAMRTELIATAADATLVLSASRRRVEVEVTSDDRERARSIVAALRERTEAERPPGTVVRTWMGTPTVDWHERTLATPSWSEIESNYPRSVRDAVASLLAYERGAHPGKLVLWHGEPGTGKTTAIRALAHEWAEWCTAHYIADPERLFADPNYLTEVASSVDDGTLQLIIAEDTDEYLRSSARRDAGSGLGRLLNLTDGFLGQGLDLLILLTTNEELGRLHPAVTRPGRCLAATEFRAFTAEEAGRWLGRPVRQPMTLAQLLEARGDLAMLSSGGPDLQATGTYL
jgi:hypothetical protein